MRLKEQEIQSIKSAVKETFGVDAKVYLFGSRIDDLKRGGDIDLYIETKYSDHILQRKLKMLNILERSLGERKIDIVINNFTLKKDIYSIAKNEGLQL